ncbi:hypothetical protein DL93DRAFT_481867 [Clavulina sp. PMI_390]|nr:hypothetical protein DL93DRAFT_481867 [Clavulina sp. PMI_390]
MASEDIPDPFFLDDDDDPLSARPTSAPIRPSSTPAASAPPPGPQNVRVAPPNPVHRPRVIKGLRNPALFLPIPTADPLNPLLGKYIPSEFRPHRDVLGDYAGRDERDLIV